MLGDCNVLGGIRRQGHTSRYWGDFKVLSKDVL